MRARIRKLRAVCGASPLYSIIFGGSLPMRTSEPQPVEALRRWHYIRRRTLLLLQRDAVDAPGAAACEHDVEENKAVKHRKGAAIYRREE